MHPEAEALLNAIYDHPDDDTPRLVYADWLQEHGQENYAQFIRLQCAAAREQLWRAEANRLWEEIGRVWYRLYYEWLPAMQIGWPFCGNEITLDAIHFRRGFLSHGVSITTDVLAFVEHCVAWIPTPTFHLHARNNEHAATVLAANPVLRRVRQLSFDVDAVWFYPSGLTHHTWTSTAVVNPLLYSPHLCNVRELDLSGPYLSTSTVNVLLDAPNLDSVEELTVYCFQPNGGELPNDAVLQPKPLRSQLRSRFREVSIETA
jgi:uncharacterized protein (TIGR02996 family)